MKPLTTLLALLVVSQTTAHAVLTYNGTAANLVAPLDDPGWDAVGSFTTNVGSAVFLGNSGGYAWLLTANHVPLGGNTLQIANSTYSAFFDAQQIGTADLKVFRLNSEITGITPVTLSNTLPSGNLTMIGYGRTGTKVTWDTTTNPWTEGGSGAEGYTWSGPNVKRWGTNEVLHTNLTDGNTIFFSTDFDPVDGQAQGSVGDSGGAVFEKVGSTWKLTGLMFAVGVTNGTSYGSSFVGQPANTSVSSITGSPNHHSVTYNVQIANYRSAILAAIPEPTVPALVGVALGVILLARKSSSRRQRS